MEIKVMADVFALNNQTAAWINQSLSSRGIFVINLLGSPGSGKTSLLEKTIAVLKDEIGIAVIEGDLFTSKDAQRIEKYGVPVVQINTGGGCHLDAPMVEKALAGMNLAGLDLIVIENVGNLVCPAEFLIGEDVKVTVLSITEGDDKPLKYPLMFKQSKVAILNKIDLLPYTSFDMAVATDDIKSINPAITLFQASCRTGEGLDDWFGWLRQQVRNKKQGE